MIDHLVLTLPIKTVSESNSREHWTARNKRKRSQQEEILFEWRNKAGQQRFKLPCRVTFTRYSTKFLDDDNIRGAFKGVRDAVASLLGVDDDPMAPVEWCYVQERTKKREHLVIIEVKSIEGATCQL